MRPEKITEREQRENRERTERERGTSGYWTVYTTCIFGVKLLTAKHAVLRRGQIQHRVSRRLHHPFQTHRSQVAGNARRTTQEEQREKNNNNKREYQTRKETTARSTLPGNVFRLQRFPKFLQSCFVVFGQRRFRSDDLHFANQMASVAGGTNETAALALGVQGQGLVLVRQGCSGTSEIGGGGQWWCGERCRCSGRGS